MAYIINFFGKEVPKKLETMDVNVYYISKKQNYAIVYADQNRGLNQLTSQLKSIRGFKNISESLSYDSNVNI